MLVNDRISNLSLRESPATLIQPTLHYLLHISQSREKLGIILRGGCFRGVSEFIFNLGSSPEKCPIIEGTVPPTAFPDSKKIFCIDDVKCLIARSRYNQYILKMYYFLNLFYPKTLNSECLLFFIFCQIYLVT